MSSQRLAVRFRDQEAFCRGYSPLYARLFGQVAGWLEEAEGDDLAAWLVESAGDRHSLEVALLLAAGLHRDVLACEPAVAELSRFFPSVGGESSPESPDFGPALRHAILARREDLAAFIQHGNVQTNETGRGLCWLLPLLSTGWPEVRLVDLGASAGLNLVAEQRAYRLVEASSETTLFDLGLGDPVQFQTRCEGLIPDFANLNGRAVPRVVTRNGCDLAPFPLQNRRDELTLMSFVWGDQLDRLERLKEAIDAFKQVNQGDAAVHLSPADLPDDLARFLQESLSMSDLSLPVVIYNTWMASYLRDNGQSMGYHIDQWATRQNHPVLWTQWEPARDGSQPPHYGWCEWTADLWWDGEHKHWRLGWVHPHGGEAHFEAGLEEYWRFWLSQ